MKETHKEGCHSLQESKIAKENVEEVVEFSGGGISLGWWKEVCTRHKQTCQRWFSFLRSIGLTNMSNYVLAKINDLKQAIKLYDDAGI